MAGNIEFASAEVFAKILTSNDDAGRHGVLIPREAYTFFPDLPIPDPDINSTVTFSAIDAATRRQRIYGWKYYQRYPERRVTRLDAKLNDTAHGKRLAIFLRITAGDGRDTYFFDASVEGVDPDFDHRIEMLFDPSVPRDPGAFIRSPVDERRFEVDENLALLLDRFDEICFPRWIPTRRTGDTGIGYTFESLVGVEENNSQDADFNGIELKTSLLRNARAGKINLFQAAPTWLQRQTGIGRLRRVGQMDPNGRYSCYSQVTTQQNNLGLSLATQPSEILLRKDAESLGVWEHSRLAARLAQKHSRAAFVKARSRTNNGMVEYQYCELVYCERPDIRRFVDMVEANRIVFEFTMTERPPGRVRNHGYPWRLCDVRLLDQLFSVQVKLR
jgi:hypothetical protein